MQRPTANATCRANATFATLINSDSYVGAALCLLQQFRRVHSVCPLILLYDDRSGRLSAESIVQLRRAFERMVPISELATVVQRLGSERVRTRDSSHNDARRRSTQAAPVGRRLYTSVTQTHAKVYVWALPWDRVAYLDLDTLLLANIDDVLSLELQLTARQPLAATPCTSNGESYFVAGFLLFKPSASKVPSLLSLTRFSQSPWNGRVPVSLRRAAIDPTYWTNICHPSDHCPLSTDGSCSPAARMFPNASDPLYKCMLAHHGHFSHMVISKACATKLGDQSIHNFLFRRRWHALPGSLGLNVDARRWRGAPRSVAQGKRGETRSGATPAAGIPPRARMIHFFGEPKPWDPRARASLPAVAEYRRVCPSLP